MLDKRTPDERASDKQGWIIVGSILTVIGLLLLVGGVSALIGGGPS
jgi:hypothetical protein